VYPKQAIFAAVLAFGLGSVGTPITANAGAKKIDLLKLCKRSGHKVSFVKGKRTGVWSGQFTGPGGGMQHMLIVRSVKADGKADVLYAHGAWKKFKIRKGCFRNKAKMDEKTLKIAFKGGRTATYNFFDTDGFATATFKSPTGTTHGRVDLEK
jgi:hypothetical protein